MGETTAVFETKNVLHDLNLINSTQSVFTKSYRHTLTADSPNTFDFFFVSCYVGIIISTEMFVYTLYTVVLSFFEKVIFVLNKVLLKVY